MSTFVSLMAIVLSFLLVESLFYYYVFVYFRWYQFYVLTYQFCSDITSFDCRKEVEKWMYNDDMSQCEYLTF